MKKKWKTKDGKEIAVEDMETSHIENALALLEREGFIGEETLNFYLSTSGPSGDIAQYYFEQEQDQVFRSPISSFIDLFEKELMKRKKINTIKKDN